MRKREFHYGYFKSMLRNGPSVQQVWHDVVFWKVCRRNPKQYQQRQLPWSVILVEKEQNKTDKEVDVKEQYVLGIDGSGSPSSMMKGKINRKKFCLLVDSGSPVSKISNGELRFCNATYYSYEHYHQTKNM